MMVSRFKNYDFFVLFQNFNIFFTKKRLRTNKVPAANKTPYFDFL